MDMRSKAYPALPEGRELRLVLPRTGDLRFRSQLPGDFKQRLYIHADPRRRFWYSRFELRRKFIVMSTQGNMYAKSIVYTFTKDDLPNKNVLSMPRVAREDLIKALDLVQCSRSEGQRWELVFTRWRNGMETCLPLEVVQLFAPDLLQEFYANSINSWAFHARLRQESLSVYRTEVELWLLHPEFQEYYRRLRQKRAGSSLASHPLQQAVDRLPVKSEPLTALFVVQPAHTIDPPVPVSKSNDDASEAVIREFEQRRLATERQERLNQSQRYHMLQQRMDKQAEELRRLQAREHERRLCQEQQRQRAYEAIQLKQREYQLQLQAQQERDRLTALQHQERVRQQRLTEQEQLREKLQQEINRKEGLAKHRTLTNERSHKTTLRPHNQLNGRHHGSPSSLQRPIQRHASSIWVTGGDEEYVPPEASESEEREERVSSNTRKESLSSQPSRKRHRKRLLYSQLEVDDDGGDDDDFPELSQLPLQTRQQHLSQGKRKDDSPVIKARKIRRGLLQRDLNSLRMNRPAVDLTQQSEDYTDHSVKLRTETVAATLRESAEDDQIDCRNGEMTSEHDDDDEYSDSNGNADVESSRPSGVIRCFCGASSVGAYRGHWLQCSNEDCGVWEHADCVGMLTNFESILSLKYTCSRCDCDSYRARRKQASRRLLDWLFQCCNSRNSMHLMSLLKDSAAAAKFPYDRKNAKYENRTLAMHVARHGLVKCLLYLLDELNVDLFETDSQSRNILHHAALGGSIVCCRILLTRDQKLLLHQDLRGCMPYHLMLQSARVNRLCIPYMRADAALLSIGDLDSNYPIHYACQGINRYTVEICQMILTAQSAMLQEKSSEGLYPLMVLCKAACISNTQHRVVNASEVLRHAKEVIALMLDVDVFGDCLNQRAPNGWSPLHFAAASGNHELITNLCNVGLSDVHYAAKSSGQSALHIAAQNDFPLCVRALLLEGLSVVRKDSNGWIPMLHTESASCIQELMHFKLTNQLSRLHRMLGKFQQRGIVQRWQRCVARDPVCFDILNDWCRSDTERIERMEGLLLSNPFLLRLDNKIEYVWRNVIQSVKELPGKILTAPEIGFVNAEKQPRQQKIAFVFSRESGCFWKQFVEMGMRLEPEDFRLPINFSIRRGSMLSQDVDSRESSLKLVLIHLAAGLGKEAPGLLIRDSSNELRKGPLLSDKDKLTAQLLTFFMLGELVAHLVLFGVPISGILDFNEAFLRCVGCKGRFRSTYDKVWEHAGRCFAAGFDGVLPATLELFHANELIVVFNASATNRYALHIDWNAAVDWNVYRRKEVEDTDATSAKAWLPRLMNELVKEEQLLVLLFITGDLQSVNDRFFRSEGVTGRITVACYSETDGVLNHDAMYPMMEHSPDVLRLPPYSCYDAFKKGILSVIRHTYQAFLPE